MAHCMHVIRGHFPRFHADPATMTRPVSAPRRCARALRIAAVLSGLAVIAVVAKFRNGGFLPVLVGALLLTCSG